MDNNEKLNAMLNSCTTPRQVYNALMAPVQADTSLESLKQGLGSTTRTQGQRNAVVLEPTPAESVRTDYKSKLRRLRKALEAEDYERMV